MAEVATCRSKISFLRPSRFTSASPVSTLFYRQLDVVFNAFNFSARPCNENGVYPADGETPPSSTPSTVNDWTPYKDRLQFEAADFLYTEEQMSGAKIDKLMELWAATALPHGDTPPFRNHNDLYDTIDSTPLGDVRWRSFHLTHPEADAPASSTLPSWKTASYEVWYRDVHEVVKRMLANPDFKGQIDFAPVQEFDADDNRQFRNFMGGDWAWAQAVSLCCFPGAHVAEQPCRI